MGGLWTQIRARPHARADKWGSFFYAAGLLAAAVLMVPTAFAQSQQYGLHEKAIERINGASQVGPLASDAFGDQLSLFNGSVEFNVVDISIPGNSSLPVELRRRYAIEDRREISDPLGLGYLGGFGEWDIDLPYLKGTFAQSTGWQVSGSSPNSRCSVTNPPSYVGNFDFYDYWQGNFLHIPGQGDSTLLRNPSSKIPDPGNGTVYPWITKSLWRISCKPTTKNGYPGEGFIALSPSGVRYHLDWVVTKATASLRGGYAYQSSSVLSRENVYFLVSRIEDRFGNAVNYNYAGDKLISITSDDQDATRQISLSYSGNNVVSASSSVGAWTYTYASSRLSQVTRPDGSKWAYAADGQLRISTIDPLPYDDYIADCPDNSHDSFGQFTYQVTHPAGAKATFEFRAMRHYRHNIPKICKKPNSKFEYLQIPNYTNSFTLMEKTITGPGLAPMTWSYTYGNGNTLSFEDFCENSPQWCAPSKLHEVHGPDGVYERYEYGILYGVNEGQLLSKAIGADASSILQTTTYTYFGEDEDMASQPFPAWVGENPLWFSDPFADSGLRPQKELVTAQQSETFTWTANTFNAFGRPVQVTKTSSLSTDQRVEVTTWHDDLNDWVLGQVAKTTVNGKVAAETGFDSLARPIWTKSFGKLKQSLTYNGDGTVATVKDGRNLVTSLSQWYLGIPRRIDYADGTHETSTVSTQGWVTSVTDAGGSKTCYAYDLLGRVKKITHPSEAGAGVCDTSAWAATTISFVPVSTTEQGISGGHWRRTESTGNARKVTYYDGLWRPVLVHEYDTAAAGTSRFNATAYDAYGRTRHVIYPIATAPTMSNGNWSQQGVRTTYDALGRVTAVEQDSELGVLTTTTEYLSGFKRRTTDPSGNATIERFQAFGAPSYDLPIRIDAPENTRTTITRDIFGKPLSIERGASN